MSGWSQVNRSPAMVCVQLSLDLAADRDRAVSGVRAWFELGWRLLGWQLRDFVLARQAGGPSSTRSFPLGVSVEYGLTGDDCGDVSDDDESWSSFLDRLDVWSDAAFGASPAVQRSDRAGDLRPASRIEAAEYLFISSTRFDEQNALVLTVQACREFLLGSSKRQQVAARFLRSVAELSGPTYGEIAYLHDALFTELESALGRSPSCDGLPAAREVLRGYSWITIAPESVGDRLGGLAYFRGSGAFHDVATLAHGGFWLQATERFEVFGGSRADAVFRALAPVLPSGDPRIPDWRETNLILRDARSVAAEPLHNS